LIEEKNASKILMKATSKAKKKMLSNELVQRILRRVPYQEGFRFSRGIGDHTGQVATSLDDFVEMLRKVELKSIDFHMGRQDFEKWIRDILGDEELAKSINRRSVFPGENGRKELVAMVTNRLNKLKKTLKTP
jgi:hypothetical protein